MAATSLPDNCGIAGTWRDLSPLFEHMAIGIVVVDKASRQIEYENQMARELLAISQGRLFEHLLRKAEEDLGHRADYDLIMKEDSRGAVIGFSIYTHEQGKLVIFLKDISTKKIFLESTQHSQFYSDFADITSEFAHEIGNPLTSVHTTLQIIVQNLDSWSKEKIADYLARVQGEIRRLTDFIVNIRQLSHGKALEITCCNLQSLVRAVLQSQELNLKVNRIDVIVDIPENLSVMVDASALHQVLLNLLLNSIDELQGLAPALIEIRVGEVDDYYAKLVYRNNGRTIPEDILEKIFHPFFSTKEKGMGLGLAISLKLMALMGGTIRARTPESGQGAEFTLYMPLRPYRL